MHKILKILFIFINNNDCNGEEELLWTIGVHNSNHWKLWSDFFKNVCKGVNFLKSCITCNFNSKLPQRYILSIKAFKTNFLIYCCLLKSFLKGRLQITLSIYLHIIHYKQGKKSWWKTINPLQLPNFVYLLNYATF